MCSFSDPLNQSVNQNSQSLYHLLYLYNEYPSLLYSFYILQSPSDGISLPTSAIRRRQEYFQENAVSFKMNAAAFSSFFSLYHPSENLEFSLSHFHGRKHVAMSDTFKRLYGVVLAALHTHSLIWVEFAW